MQPSRLVDRAKGVSEDFVRLVEQQLVVFPPHILKALAEKGVRLKLTPTMEKGNNNPLHQLNRLYMTAFEQYRLPTVTGKTYYFLGVYNPLTKQMTVPENIPKYIKNDQSQGLTDRFRKGTRPLTHEDLADTLVHEMLHAIDANLGDTSLKDGLKAKRMLTQVGLGAGLIGLNWVLPKSMRGLAGQAVFAVGAYQLTQGGMMAKHPNSFSLHPDFLKSLAADLKALSPAEKKAFEKSARYSLRYFSKPYEAFAFITTAQLVDSEINRTIQKTFPQTSAWVKQVILPKITA